MRAGPILCAAALLSGCALPVAGEIEAVSNVARYATHYDHVIDPEANLLDRALAECPEKTVKAETACVRQGIDAAHTTAGALIALVPGCRAGQVCHYDHTTRDSLGFVEASATVYVKRWRIELDVRNPNADGAAVAIKVIDREDFDTATPGAKPG